MVGTLEPPETKRIHRQRKGDGSRERSLKEKRYGKGESTIAHCYGNQKKLVDEYQGGRKGVRHRDSG